MVVSLQIGIWLGTKLDREKSQGLKGIKVNKLLLPKEILQPVQIAATTIRTHFYSRTLPWKLNGDRLLTCKGYPQFWAEHCELVKQFDQAVKDFIEKVYLAERERASFLEVETFHTADYPEVAKLRSRYYCHLDIDPIAEARDINLSPADLKSVRQIMEAQFHIRVAAAVHDVWQRIENTLGHFVAKIGSAEIFRNTTVKNLEELAELLPSFNIMEDPTLDVITNHINNLCLDPSILRSNRTIRAKVAGEARRILDSVIGYTHVH